MKIYPAETELFQVDRHTDRQTDMVKLIVTFHNFANAPKNCISRCHIQSCVLYCTIM